VLKFSNTIHWYIECWTFNRNSKITNLMLFIRYVVYKVCCPRDQPCPVNFDFRSLESLSFAFNDKRQVKKKFTLQSNKK
jgi:hypothetical protein